MLSNHNHDTKVHNTKVESTKQTKTSKETEKYTTICVILKRERQMKRPQLLFDILQRERQSEYNHNQDQEYILQRERQMKETTTGARDRQSPPHGLVIRMHKGLSTRSDESFD